MSTYLLAFVISDYTCKNGTAHPIISKNVDVSVCARPNAFNQLDLAFDSSIEILEYFEKFYDVVYPLTKLGKRI
jgi:aminopeptidase N